MSQLLTMRLRAAPGRRSCRCWPTAAPGAPAGRTPAAGSNGNGETKGRVEGKTEDVWRMSRPGSRGTGTARGAQTCTDMASAVRSVQSSPYTWLVHDGPCNPSSRSVHVGWYTPDVRPLTRTVTGAPGHREGEEAGWPAASRTVKVMELQGPKRVMLVVQALMLKRCNCGLL